MADGFGGVCCIYDDDAWLPMMVNACYSKLDQLIFLVGRRPWNGDPGNNERTLATIKACTDPHKKIVVVEDNWRDEAAQRNRGLELCAEAGLPFCFIVDADEIYDEASLEMMMSVVAIQTNIDAWYVPQVTYWKSYRYRIEMDQSNVQMTFVRVGATLFRGNRGTDARRVSTLPVQLGLCHHLSYARTDEQVLKKIARFSHAHQVRPGWFEDTWRRWDADHEMENLHPIWPPWYRRAVPQDASAYPPLLRQLYERERIQATGDGVN